MTTIEPLICPECEKPPLLWLDSDNRAVEIACGAHIYIADESVGRNGLVALWNEKIRKILQTKAEHDNKTR